jgi:alkylhydroperoxidase family enzyme
MARIRPISEKDLSPSIQVAFERNIEEYDGRITNSKATLAHSLLAFEVYMQWHLLYKQVEKILGKRLAYLYAFAISKASDCQLCAAFFRKIIIDAGEKPERLLVTVSQKEVMDFGSSIAMYHGNINNHVYDAVAERYNQEEMVVLIAFAGQMIAANVFNNTIETDIDEYLVNYLPILKCSPDT